MTDKLLQYYEKELAFLQQSASDFARKHPGTASGLQITEDSINDPLVGQLISGVAYMNARIHQKIDDDLPELSDAVLETLYPHYLRPIPSLTIVQCPPLSDLDKIHTIPTHTVLQTISDVHDTCKFTTCAPIDVTPFLVESVKLVQKPFIAPGSNSSPNADAVLKISLKTFDEQITFDTLKLDSLRFYLKGPKQHTLPLYDLLFGECTSIVLARSDIDTSPFRLSVDSLQSVGFDNKEALLPYPDNSFSGYRLLSEYFALPEKFLFCDIKNLLDYTRLLNSNQLNIYVYLNRHNSELEHQVSPSLFALNCAPAINLFEQNADPIRVTHTEYTYPIEPDARHHNSLEIYSVDTVSSINSRGQKSEFQRFYSANHKQPLAEQSAFWFSKRREITEGEHGNEKASEVDIGVVDLGFNPFNIAKQSLEIKLHCSNRNLPSKLPTSNGQPYLALVSGSAPIESIRCVLPPTDSIRPPQGKRAYWRLISHLNLNHLSLSQGQGSLEALKEILRLYDFRDSASTRNRIESIQAIKTKAITAPIQIDGTVALCRGTEIVVTLDTLMLSGASILIFANLLNHFFGLYCSINSFTKLNIKLSGKEGVVYKWPPRAGAKALV